MKYALVIDGMVDSISHEPQEAPWVPVPDVVFAGFVQAGARAWAPPPQPSDAERRSAWRSGAYLEKGAFVDALLDAEILSANEAIQASRGDWPQTFADALGTLPIDAVRAQVAWGSARGVARLNPVFQALLGWYATAHGLTPEQADDLGDSLFGWSN